VKNIMKNTLNAFLISTALLCAAIPGRAQTILTPTTLSAAVTTLPTRTIVVASATGFTAGQTDVYIDRSLYPVVSVSGTTIGLGPAVSGTADGTHVSGALVWVGTPIAFNQNPRINFPNNGSCKRSDELYLPLINVATGTIADCLGGQWIKGDAGTGSVTASRWRVYAPEPGGTIYTSLNGTGTAVGATTLYCTEVWLPANKLLTGIGVLNGTTVTGNARYVVLYDSTGNPIANSALAGQASVSASVYEQYAFTAKYFAVGPAQFFACIQDNAVGSTTVRMAVTQVNDNILTKGQTGATFGTIPTLTVPTTFTTAVGPYVYLY
jgi:hypothetical protein